MKGTNKLFRLGKWRGRTGVNRSSEGERHSRRYSRNGLEAASAENSIAGGFRLALPRIHDRAHTMRPPTGIRKFQTDHAKALLTGPSLSTLRVRRRGRGWHGWLPRVSTCPALLKTRRLPTPA